VFVFSNTEGQSIIRQ